MHHSHDFPQEVNAWKELTRKLFGFEQTYMYEIWVTGPLNVLVSVFFCKLVQTCSRCHCRCHYRSHTQCGYINYKGKWGLWIKCSKQYEWLQNAQSRKVRWSHVITAHYQCWTPRQWHLWSCPQVHQYRSYSSATRNEALSTNVDSKLTEKMSSGVLSSSSHSHLHLRRHMEGTVFLFHLTHGVQTFNLVLGSIYRVFLSITRPSI